MSLCLPTSTEFPPPLFFIVGTFLMSTGTVLIRTPYDALTVKITRSALHVWSNSFSSPALSRAFTHSKARYGVSRDLIAPAFEGFGCISVQTEVVWKGEKSPSVSLRLVRAKNQNKNQNKNQIKQGLWWKFQQVAINHHTSTMHSNISAVSLWKRYDSTVRYTGVCLPETEAVCLLTGVCFTVSFSLNECRTLLHLAVLLIQFNETTDGIVHG